MKPTFKRGQHSTKSDNWIAHVFGEVLDLNHRCHVLVGTVTNVVDSRTYLRCWTATGKSLASSLDESDNIRDDYTLVCKEVTPANPDATLTAVNQVSAISEQPPIEKLSLTNKPCNLPCPKCGSTDVRRKHFFKGEDTLEGVGPSDNERSSDFVNRKDGWKHPAEKECIVHACRCCGYMWDTEPLQDKS